MTLYDGQTWEERSERIRREEAENKASVQRAMPVVTGVDADGRGVDVEFTLNGERVWGSFMLVCWRRPPADYLAKCKKNLSNPPLASYGRPPRRLPK
jgi:hypothetical protein